IRPGAKTGEGGGLAAKGQLEPDQSIELDGAPHVFDGKRDGADALDHIPVPMPRKPDQHCQARAASLVGEPNRSWALPRLAINLSSAIFDGGEFRLGGTDERNQAREPAFIKRQTAQARAYSQAVITEGVRTAWLAGQVG